MLREYERQIIVTMLTLAGWNQRRVAASLGLLPSTLSEKMKRLGVRDPMASAGASDQVDPTGREAAASQAQVLATACLPAVPNTEPDLG